MMTYGNCPGEDQLCRKVRHPLGYYEARRRSIEGEATAEAGQAKTARGAGEKTAEI
jgi:DNA primase large subunit